MHYPNVIFLFSQHEFYDVRHWLVIVGYKNFCTHFRILPINRLFKSDELLPTQFEFYLLAPTTTAVCPSTGRCFCSLRRSVAPSINPPNVSAPSGKLAVPMFKSMPRRDCASARRISITRWVSSAVISG